MSFRRRALFLAGLFVAVSCSDAGGPMGPDVPGQPEPEAIPSNVLQALTCRVDVRGRRVSCEPQQPNLGDAMGVAVATGNPNYVPMQSANHLIFVDSTTIDVRFVNQIPQTLGTTDGVTPASTGIRVWVNPPVVTDTTVPGQEASAVVGNEDGTLTHQTHRDRPYFQYPGLLATGDTSIYKHWRFDTENVDAFSFGVYVLAEVQFAHGSIDLVPDPHPVIQVDSTATLTARVRGVFGQQHRDLKNDSLRWMSTNPAVVTVQELVPDTMAQITAVGEGTAWIKVRSGSSTAADTLARRDSVLITVDNKPVVPDEAMNVLMNVRASFPDSVLLNNVPEGATLKMDTTYTTPHGTATISSTGRLTYASTGGYMGPDSILYKVSNANWTVFGKVMVTVQSSNYWFVQPGASGTGSNSSPFGTIAQASSAAGAHPNPDADSIFVLRNGSTQLTGATTLQANQALIGQGVPTLFQITRTPNGTRGTDTVFVGLGLGTDLTNSGPAATLSLGSGNSVRGLTLLSNGGATLEGSNFGTLRVGELFVQARGPALTLSNGNLRGTFVTLHSKASTTHGISLTNVSDSLNITGGASIDSAGGTSFVVSGGTTVVNFPGNIHHVSTSPLLSVTNNPGAFAFTGTLTDSAGAGLRFDNADGSYAFGGTVSLAGGDAGVDLLNGSDGSFTFASTTILNPSGIGLNVNQSAPTSLSYTGSISTSANRPVAIERPSAGACGTITIAGGISGTGQGLLVQNCNSGTISFNGAKTLNTGANQAVALNNNAGATINFGSGGALAITTTTGIGFGATGGTVNVAGGSNTISTGAATALRLNSVVIGASNMAFSSVSATAADSAVALTSVTGGTLSSGGGTITGAAGGAPFTVRGGSVGGTWANNISQGANGSLFLVNNGHTGSFTFSGTVSGTSGNGLQFDNADGTYNFTGTVTLNGGDAGIDVTNNSGGTFTFPATSNIMNPSTGNLVSILNSAPTFTYPGAFTKGNNNVTGILVSNNTGGTITFSGSAVTKSITSGNAAAVNLSNNGGATINFTGGGLSLSSGSGAGFTATGGGTVSITGANNTVNSNGGGTAVNVQTTTIGGGGLNFYSVTATGGGTNGIVLSNTGGGGMQVTGDGASDTGNQTRGRTTAGASGTIGLGSGGTISGKSSDGVSLISTGQVILRNMVIQSNSGDGVQATSATGVTIDNARITGHTDNSGVFFTSVGAPTIIHSEIENNAFGAGAPGSDIHNVRLISNTGTGSVQSSVIANSSAGAERQLQIFSTTGTLNITVTNNRIAGSTVGDGVGVYAFGSSNITANFQNDSIHNNSAFGIDSGTETTQSSSLNLTVNNSKFRNNFVGVTVAHGSSGTNTFNVTNNNFQNHGSISVNINRLGAVSFNGFGLFSGTVSGNIIGTAGVANSGSPLGTNAIDVKTNGNGGTTQVAIVNNTIREIGNDGIRVIGRDANVGHTLHARIQNNNMANFHASALSGIRGELGAAPGDKITMCLNISGNTVTNAPQNGVRVRSVTGGSPPPQITLTMPSFAAPGDTYLANQNPAATGLTANTSFANANAGSTTTAGNCTTP